MASRKSTADRVATHIRTTLDGVDLEWAETGRGLFTVTLPGTRKQTTECALEIGKHTLSARAFVSRRPDENHAAVYGWLLQRNVKLVGVSFALDTLGDIYLVGRVPLSEVNEDTADRLLAMIATTADDSFNQILELGFAESIKKEWRWRLARGESTANLAAFENLAPERVINPSTEP
ncbi:MAG: YbjN domain-containing protein [Propionibacterium sp.]|nr:YbjN domain-containing protein [Propionibacterium sp.]